jgi:predicted dehydrogenase
MRTLGDYGDSYRGQWQHLVDVVTAGVEPESTLEDGREALRVVLAATASASEGRPVRVDEGPRTITQARRG